MHVTSLSSVPLLTRFSAALQVRLYASLCLLIWSSLWRVIAGPAYPCKNICPYAKSCGYASGSFSRIHFLYSSNVAFCGLTHTHTHTHIYIYIYKYTLSPLSFFFAYYFTCPSTTRSAMHLRVRIGTTRTLWDQLLWGYSSSPSQARLHKSTGSFIISSIHFFYLYRNKLSYRFPLIPLLLPGEVTVVGGIQIGESEISSNFVHLLDPRASALALPLPSWSADGTTRTLELVSGTVVVFPSYVKVCVCVMADHALGHLFLHLSDNSQIHAFIYI